MASHHRLVKEVREGGWENKADILPVRDVDASIARPLQRTKDASTSGGPGKTNIKVAAESTGLALDTLHVELLTCDLYGTLVHGVKVEFL